VPEYLKTIKVTKPAREIRKIRKMLFFTFELEFLKNIKAKKVIAIIARDIMPNVLLEDSEIILGKFLKNSSI
jgi:hypothetical protein